MINSNLLLFDAWEEQLSYRPFLHYSGSVQLDCHFYFFEILRNNNIQSNYNLIEFNLIEFIKVLEVLNYQLY